MAPDDLQSHADLAHAYREMGLRADALREAGVVLRASQASQGIVALALRVVFHREMLKTGGVSVLRGRLRPI